MIENVIRINRMDELGHYYFDLPVIPAKDQGRTRGSAKLCRSGRELIVEVRRRNPPRGMLEAVSGDLIPNS